MNDVLKPGISHYTFILFKQMMRIVSERSTLTCKHQGRIDES